MKTAVYHAGKFLVRFVFGCVARIHVIGRENARCADGFLLASNHISHFDPFLISLPVRRKIDWMTMAEFFRPPALGFFLRSIDAFPGRAGPSRSQNNSHCNRPLKKRTRRGPFS